MEFEAAKDVVNLFNLIKINLLLINHINCHVVFFFKLMLIEIS